MMVMCRNCGNEWKGPGEYCEECIAETFEERSKIETEVMLNKERVKLLSDIIEKLTTIEERLKKLEGMI